MPIPPRPIPNHRHRAPRPSTSSTNRPGSNVPRKSLPSSSSAFCSGSGEWRAEMALLPELRASSAGGRFGALSPTAGPSATAGGALIREGGKPSPSSSPLGEGEVHERDGRREVPLERLINDGRGKREKRATTAATLGFDFVPNPSVIALPEMEGEAKPGLLTSTKSTAPALAPDRASPALSATPTTPALFSTHLHPDAASDSDSEGEDDWEHVSMFGRAEDEEGEEERDENVDSDGEEDVIVLGEMEMEEDMSRLDLASPAPTGKGKKEGKKEKRGRVSYAAAALGGRL
ncbi:hypothetical protein L202_01982 [Cryptococcus amylolentus CBS 6039]|uniref:Uncharacterized protein n=1 Tax=Cryptococcus amylolentus CBS 6039 TaxID=1295533 RepID=A0A1E3HZ81_9TREE|nr:hypothetical protein L202_01982 [Cryptococcus amylolentus CBS 6039]ODN81567.1 hypothetical protein L202_01982 [Cryptococcus amylolentus CBS 6039]